jgi:hypothetical protein
MVKNIIKYNNNWEQITIEDQRFYKNKDDYYPSVTYILSYYPKGKHFEKWLKENGENADDIAKESASSGHKVHQAIENLLKEKEILWIKDGYSQYSLHEWKMILSFNEFWNLYKPKLIHSEYHIFSNKYKYAGTIDLIVEINDKLWILDMKTTNALHTTNDLQLAAYKEAWDEFHDRKIDNYGILWLKSKSRKVNKDKMQGNGWALVQSERNHEENFDIFSKTYDIFKIENPITKPIFQQYPNSIKIEF